MDLRVGGQGNAGVAGGPTGDLIVGIEVEPSEAFVRQGQDLHGVLDVSITQATLGGDLEIETLDGPERLRIEAGTESGTVLRLKGKGRAAPAAPRSRRPLRDAPHRHAGTTCRRRSARCWSDWPSCAVSERVATAAWHGTFAGQSSARE